MITKYYQYNILKSVMCDEYTNTQTLFQVTIARNVIFFYSNPRSKDSAREFLSTSYGKFTMIFLELSISRVFFGTLHFSVFYLYFISFQCNFNIDILDKEVDMDAINAEVIGPSGPVYLNFDLGPNGGRGSFQVSFSFG